ncbi:MAG: DNA polymerase III subunit gamma/tau, partial [Actinobacteria bacterium]|nr:DNA polymerase III subunit gamma/tau [Actinomycetota bacterium]
GPTPDPCGVCQSCTDLAANGPGSLDVIELDAASHGGVEDTRDLRERAMFAPASSRYKVYIIDEAHMVTTAGFNALLKLVEEPPEHVRFVFATTEAEKVLPTIRSRTHNYTFRLVSAKVLAEHLASVCAAEGVPADPAALALVARAGAGSVRDSLSILSQVISGCGPEGVTYAEAVAQLGMTDAALLDETIEAMAGHDGAALFMVIDRVMEAGHEPRRFATDLLERLRDLIVLQHVPHAVEINLIDAPEDQVAREVVQAQSFGPAELGRAADVVSEALSDLRGATAPRLHLELMAARLLLPASDADERGTRARLDQIERRMATAAFQASTTPPAALVAATPTTPALAQGAGGHHEPAAETLASAEAPTGKPKSGRAPRKLSEVTDRAAPTAAPEAKTAAAPESARPPAAAVPTAAATATASDGGLPEMRSMWPAVLDALKTYSRVAWMAFANSAPISVSNGVLAVAIDSAGTAINIKSSGHDERLRQAILDVLRLDVKVDVVLAPNSAGAAAVAAAAPAPASAAGRSTAPEPVSAVDSSAAIDLDTPSIDDDDAVEESGIDLVMRTLGATQIGEIEH